MPAVGAAADGRANPERQCVGGIRGDGWNSREQQRREGHKTPATGDRVHGSAERSGEKQ